MLTVLYSSVIVSRRFSAQRPQPRIGIKTALCVRYRHKIPHRPVQKPKS